MCRDALVVVVFPDQAAAWNGVGSLRALGGGVVVFAAVVLASDEHGHCRVVTSLDQDPLSEDLSRGLAALIAPPALPAVAGTSSGQCLSYADRITLAGILTVLPREHAAVVAEVFECAPTPLERRMTALGGRLVHRSPRRDFAHDLRQGEDEAQEVDLERTPAHANGVQRQQALLASDPPGRDLHWAVEIKIAVIEGRIAGSAGKTKALLSERLEDLRSAMNKRAHQRKADARASNGVRIC